MPDVLQAIAERSSTRSFTNEKLTAEEVDCLLLAALQAPTAINRQEIHVTAIDGSHPVLAQIEAAKNAGLETAPACNFYYDAPMVLILSGDGSFPWTAVDAGIAVENVALAAEGLGLGSVIIGCIKDALTGEQKDAFAQALQFPDGYRYQIAIAVGHKAASKAPHTCDMAGHVTRL